MKQDGSVEEFVSALQQLRAVAPDEAQQTTIETIFSDLRSAECNVVVVGEFNRGKSTLVNAFLGEAILPCDVVPTTAKIHKIRYSDNPTLKLYGRNGRVEEEAMTARQLRAFAAGNDLNADDVEFLEMGLPLPQLEGLCIVDTPGVNDLNAHRCEVTYSFVPRADAVVFLLDARSPVRRSEIDFLQSCITKSGIERIIFIANFTDGLEPEECEQLKLSIPNRLRAALGGDGFSLIFMSAKEELASASGLNADAEGLPGLSQLNLELNRLRQTGSMATVRARQFAHRGYAVGRSVMTTLEAREGAALASVEGLTKALADLDDFGAAQKERERSVSNYVSDRRQEILAITRKSLTTFDGNLRAKVRQTIEAYSGTQFHELITTGVPALVRRELKNWIDSHSPAMRKLVQQTEHNVCLALSKSYRTVITASNRPGALPLRDADVNIPSLSAEDLSFTNVKAGLLGGGAAAMLMLIGMGPLAPIVGMAGLPFLQRFLLDKKLREAKAKALEELGTALTKCMNDLSFLVCKAIDDDLQSMTVAVQERFKQLVNDATAAMRTEIASRTSSRGDDAARLDQIRSSRKQAGIAMERLLAITEIKTQEEQAA